MLTTGDYVRDIIQRLSWFVGDVKIRNSFGLSDVNVFAEDFFCELLNLMLDLRLENINRTHRNYPAIDMADKDKRIAVQVTSTTTRHKIQHVLSQFYEYELDRAYDRLILVLIAPEKPVYKKAFTIQQQLAERGFVFDLERDVWDLPHIVNIISSLDGEKIEQIARWINVRMSDPSKWTDNSIQRRAEIQPQLLEFDLQMFSHQDSSISKLEKLLKALEYELRSIKARNSMNEQMDKLQSTTTSHLGKLWDVLHTMESSLDCSKESVWHKIFSDNEWVLAQLFDQPHIKFREKAYVGGKDLGNHNGNECDFVYQSTQSSNLVLIEIKNPCAPIVGHEYRGTFGLSHELTGALNQVLNYRDHLVKEYYGIKGNTSAVFQTYNPKCVIIVGKMSSMDIAQVAAFENFRNTLNNVTIITFDEICKRTRYLLGMLSGLE